MNSKIKKILTCGLAVTMLSAGASAYFNDQGAVAETMFDRPNRAKWCHKGVKLGNHERVDDSIKELGVIVFKLQEEHRRTLRAQDYDLSGFTGRFTEANANYVILHDYIAARMRGDATESGELVRSIAAKLNARLPELRAPQMEVESLASDPQKYIVGTRLEKFIDEAKNPVGQDQVILDPGTGLLCVGAGPDKRLYTGMVVNKECEAGGSSRYTGDILNGKYHGQGTLKEVGGMEMVICEGEFANGELMTGRGRRIEPDTGFVYHGEFLNGKYHGKGLRRHTDSSLQEGEFKDGRFMAGHEQLYEQPEGDYRWSYEGSIVNGLREGEGTYTWGNGTSYTGGFKAGIMEGHGRLTWPTGDVYEGEFKDNKQNGPGKLIKKDGTIEEGAWKNGELIARAPTATAATTAAPATLPAGDSRPTPTAASGSREEAEGDDGVIVMPPWPGTISEQIEKRRAQGMTMEAGTTPGATAGSGDSRPTSTAPIAGNSEEAEGGREFSMPVFPPVPESLEKRRAQGITTEAGTTAGAPAESGFDGSSTSTATTVPTATGTR